MKEESRQAEHPWYEGDAYSGFGLWKKKKFIKHNAYSDREFRWKNIKEEESSQALTGAMVFDRMPSVISHQKQVTIQKFTWQFWMKKFQNGWSTTQHNHVNLSIQEIFKSHEDVVSIHLIRVFHISIVLVLSRGIWTTFQTLR
jgi:hypothetical protein